MPTHLYEAFPDAQDRYQADPFAFEDALCSRLASVDQNDPDGKKLDAALTAGLPLATLESLQNAPAASTLDALSEKAKVFQQAFVRDGMPVPTYREASIDSQINTKTYFDLFRPAPLRRKRPSIFFSVVMQISLRALAVQILEGSSRWFRLEI